MRNCRNNTPFGVTKAIIMACIMSTPTLALALPRTSTSPRLYQCRLARRIEYSKRGPGCGRGTLACGAAALADEAASLSLCWACVDLAGRVLTQLVLTWYSPDGSMSV